MLTPHLSWFVRRHLRSAEDLDILMLLWHRRDRWWTAAEVARELGIPAVAAADGLGRMAGGLLNVRAAEDPAFQFAPGSEDLEANVATLQRLCQADREQIVGFIAASRPRTAIADFADAFRLKKKEDQ